MPGRYLAGARLPVWLVPRWLEYNETKVPVVVTGFGKSSTLPENVSDLLALPAEQDIVHVKDNLRDLVAALLRPGLEGWLTRAPGCPAECRGGQGSGAG